MILQVKYSCVKFTSPLFLKVGKCLNKDIFVRISEVANIFLFAPSALPCLQTHSPQRIPDSHLYRL